MRLLILCACVLALGLAFGFGYHTAKLAGKFALASQLNAQADVYRKTVEQWQQRVYAADEALRIAQQKFQPHRNERMTP